MALPTELSPGTSYRLLYSGEVGVAGVDVEQSWDLTLLPLAVREDPNFRDLFHIFVRPVGAGVSAVSKDVEFLPEEGLPEEIVLTLTAATEADAIDIEFWFMHSVVR